MNKKKHLNTLNMAMAAMLGTLAMALMLLEINVPLVPEFVKLDFSDIPIVIGTFVMGPLEGILIATLKILLKLLFKPTSTAYVGEFANWLFAVAYIIPAGLVYNFKRTKTGAAIALLAGTLTTSIVAVIANTLFIFPAYSRLYGMPMEVIISLGTKVNSHITSLGTMMLYSIFPFNIVKYGLASVITFLVYKRLRRFMTELGDRLDESRAKRKSTSAN